MENDNRQNNGEDFGQDSGFTQPGGQNVNYTQNGDQNNGFTMPGGQNNGFTMPGGQNNGFSSSGSQNGGYNQGGFQPSGYQQPPYSQSTVPVSQSSAFSIAGMVLGIISLLCCCAWYFSFFIAVLGLIFSIISLRKGMPGRGMAIAGAVCSGIALLITIALGVMVIFGRNSIDEYQLRRFLNELE